MNERENHELRFESKGFFMVPDIIFELDPALSNPAFRMYVYLQKLANRGSQAFPSYSTIMANCNINKRANVKSAIDELVNHGLLHVENRVRPGTKELTSNLYTVFNKPSSQAGYIKKMQRNKEQKPHSGSPRELREGSSLGEPLQFPEGTTLVPSGNHPSSPGELELNPLNQTHLTKPSECVCGATRHNAAASPPPARAQKKVPLKKSAPGKANNAKDTTKNHNTQTIPLTTDELQAVRDRTTYGEYNMVNLADADYKKLIEEYGEGKTKEYINRLDEHIASTGKRYKNHMATIRKWIRQDTAKAATQKTAPIAKQSRFVNFDQRENDYSLIEKKERDYLLQQLK